MAYDTRGILPVDSLAPGRTVLGTGPPLVGERALGHRFLARGLDAGEGAVLVTTSGDAEQARDAVESHADGSTGPLAVIAMDEASYEDTEEDLTWRISSPADLTGIGIAITEAMETVTERGTERLRLVIDSISPLAVYSEFERVYRFLHVILGRVAAVDGIAFCYLQSDTVGDRSSAIQGLADGILEFREGEAGPEYRLEGLPEAPTEWLPVPGEEPAATAARPATDAGTEDAVVAPPATPPESLHALIERMSDEGQTLTVYNYDGDAATRERLATYLDRLNVDVRTVETPVETPRNTAVLHRGGEPIDMAPVGVLDRAIRIQEDPDAGRVETFERPTLLTRAEDGVYSVDDGKRYLIDISRLVEQEALDEGRGTLYTGFQRLDRLDDEYGTRRIYERLADTDVTVNLFGGAGTEPGTDRFHLHTGTTDELADSWFVVFDGAGEDDRKVALVSEERDPGRYHGFWTRRPELVDGIVTYLRETYPVDARSAPEQ